MMAQFIALAPGVEVNGAAILSVVEGMGAFIKPRKILARYGIVDPKAGEWYSQQAWLDAFKEIAERIGPATLRVIGNKIPEVALWPPGVDTVEKALASIDVAYHMNHRGGEIGHYHYQRINEQSARMVCDNPYPDDFDLGIIEATARRFSPEGTLVFVRHDDSQPCRKKDGDSCTYLVVWG
jgi:hypothetical protein